MSHETPKSQNLLSELAAVGGEQKLLPVRPLRDVDSISRLPVVQVERQPANGSGDESLAADNDPTDLI